VLSAGAASELPTRESGMAAAAVFKNTRRSNIEITSD
jgi:hypothetical protein